MARKREAEYKPLSFSTTMRNPLRIADFLKCILPYEGQTLTNEIIMSVASSLIKKNSISQCILAAIRDSNQF